MAYCEIHVNLAQITTIEDVKSHKSFSKGPLRAYLEKVRLELRSKSMFNQKVEDYEI